MKIYPTQDPKYGIAIIDGIPRLINNKSGNPIPLLEPVVLFRAQDMHLPDTLLFYHNKCENREHQQAIDKRFAEVKEFQSLHPNLVKQPDT